MDVNIYRIEGSCIYVTLSFNIKECNDCSIRSNRIPGNIEAADGLSI